jgi:hypothetical protein
MPLVVLVWQCQFVVLTAGLARETQASAATDLAPSRAVITYLADALLEEEELFVLCDGEGRPKLLSSSLMLLVSEAVAPSVRR